MSPYGRGGAGNIQVVQQEAAKAATDLEANHLPISSHPSDQLPGDYLLHSGQQYAHTGRGGMGNVIDPMTLKHSESVTPSTSRNGRAASTVSIPATSAPAAHGRGGAGNHEFSAGLRDGEATRRREEERVSREKLEADVEMGVRDTIAKPKKALLATGKLH